ncbi:MAG: GHKL domain-containing protein [Lachnospiraceae bacterium]|nr:GHKL domain-containing protein [Lachnospiraceae bacterium]
MDMSLFLSTAAQFLVLIPSALLCYLPARDHLNEKPGRILLLCLAASLLYVPAASCLAATRLWSANAVFLPSLLIFFGIYHWSVSLDIPRKLFVFLSSCAFMSFPSLLSYAFDAWLHPDSGALKFSVEASFFQLGLSCLLLLALAWPCEHAFRPLLRELNFPQIWYAASFFSCAVTLFNYLMVPQSYATLRVGRVSSMYFVLEAILFVLLLFFYAMFHYTAIVLLRHARLEEENRFLDIQASQYHALQNRMQQARMMRHDFKHSVHALSVLAEEGDLEGLRQHLHDYEESLELSAHHTFCHNAALNALFNYYYEQAKTAGIRTNWRISLPEPLPFPELDLLSQLGNLLENALFGCQTLPEEQRRLDLTIEVRNHALYIVSSNSFDGQVEEKNGGYRSTRANGQGVGLLSMQRIAAKYNGLFRVSHSDREFFIDILLPLPEADSQAV